jgi:DNA-binding Xre family transcriptional regulator
VKTKIKKKSNAAGHTGSSFDSFLEEEGIREEVEAVAVKRVISWQLAEAMRKKKKTKQALARELNTSRSQLDRLLDPENAAVSLDTINRAAHALGKRLIIHIADAKAS